MSKGQESWTWKGIRKIRDLMRKHCFSKLGNGKDTSVWNDMWCHASPISRHVTKHMIDQAHLSHTATVAEMIDNGNWKWPREWYGNVDILRRIEVPALNEQMNDKVVWINNKGHELRFSVSNVWQDVRDNGRKVNWAKIVWFTQCIPRHAFILWLAIKGRLNTQDRLAKWYPLNQYKCVFCKNQEDSIKHLFFDCGFSRWVWQELKGKINGSGIPNQWEGLIQWFVESKCPNKAWNVVQRITLAACVYWIWKERNCRVFKKVSTLKEEIRDKIMECVKLRLLTLNFKNCKAVEELKSNWEMTEVGQ